ncbi:hypothetical protein BDV3_004359 [Batrachochytrium dendrobatidis]
MMESIEHRTVSGNTTANSRVMLLPLMDNLSDQSVDVRVLSLPSPATGLASAFLLVPTTKTHCKTPALFQVHLVEAPFKSWAIDNQIIADGSLYVTTPYDPLFVLAPILDFHRQKSTESPGRFMQWTDLVVDDNFPDFSLLASTLDEHIISSICDINDIENIGLFYRLSDSKFLAWLNAKVDRLVVKASNGSIPAFIPLIEDAKLLHNTPADTLLYQRIAFQTIAEHLTPKWKEMFLDHLGFKNDPIWSKQHVYFNSEITKRTASSLPNTSTKPTKQIKLSRGQHNIAKASKSGMKPLTSFFKPATTKPSSK